ncbi:MAG: folylpolyglutamate synthase/dihydrofolate synthase family protein [Xenococcaceae cyanobacterium]
MNIDSLLKPFQRFGVHLGLERIERLLADLGNPHHLIPIIHVAGTNGKGSVCAYLCAVLTEAGYKVGRYTSPHLVDWTERICLNEQPISAAVLEQVLLQIQQAINPERESPTQFEVITAAAWLYFAQSHVDVAVMEVGLGGRLDATNVCHNPLLSIITSISREHWQNLGPTLADIARQKAGILKPGCPAVIGNLPSEAKKVVASRINQLNCPAIWVQPAIALNSENVKERWASYQGINYPLPLLGEVQLMNSAIAIASLQILQQQGWKIPEPAIQTGMAKTRWQGRLQWTTWNNYPILIDGAHNAGAAQALRQYIDTLDKPVTWVMGILSTKDHVEIFKALLRPADQLYLVPVPDHSTAEPEALAILAATICPDLGPCQTFSQLFTALKTAIENTNNSERLVVLCGSLYLIGHFLKQR